MDLLSGLDLYAVEKFHPVPGSTILLETRGLDAEIHTEIPQWKPR
jgi:hypothetical protein